MKNYLIIILFILCFDTATASCLACWEQRKVEIIMITGDTLTGYVQWNDLWVEDSIKFPQSLLIRFKRMDENPLTQNSPYKVKLLLTERFIDVKNDSIQPFFCTKEEWVHELDYKQIFKIREINTNEELRSGAGEVPVLTQNEIDKLSTNPVMVVRIDESVCETSFVSYNKSMTRQILTQVSQQNKDELIRELKSKGVIVYTICWD